MINYLQKIHDFSFEAMSVSFVDNNNQVDHFFISNTRNKSMGTINYPLIKECIKHLTKENIFEVFICHNHPKSNPKPSPGDEIIRKRLVSLFNLNAIKVSDFIIVSSKGYYSEKEKHGSLRNKIPSLPKSQNLKIANGDLRKLTNPTNIDPDFHFYNEIIYCDDIFYLSKAPFSALSLLEIYDQHSSMFSEDLFKNPSILIMDRSKISRINLISSVLNVFEVIDFDNNLNIHSEFITFPNQNI